MNIRIKVWNYNLSALIPTRNFAMNYHLNNIELDNYEISKV